MAYMGYERGLLGVDWMGVGTTGVSTIASMAAAGSVVPGIGTAIGAAAGFISSLFGGKKGPTREQKIASSISDCNSILQSLNNPEVIIAFIKRDSPGGRGWPCAMYKVLKAYAPTLIPYECSDQSLVYGKSGDPCAPVPTWLNSARNTVLTTPGWENHIRSFFAPPPLALPVTIPPGTIPTGVAYQPGQTGAIQASILPGGLNWTAIILIGGMLGIAAMGTGAPIRRRGRKE